LLKPVVRLKWHLAGRPLPAPHAVKEAILRDYAIRYKTSVLVETGTLWGDTIAETRTVFEELYTIELSRPLWERATMRFRGDPSIHTFLGDSAAVLPEVLGKLDRPALFWLDGHSSGGPTSRGDLNTPIIQEVELVLSHSVTGHTLLIDDARCFNGTEDYPRLDDFRKTLARLAPQYDFAVETDIIRFTPPVS
jgi:hypothetical protein